MHMMDNNYWIVRREQHEVIATLYEENIHNYEVVIDVVNNLHNQVLELGSIDPPMCGSSRRRIRPNIARGKIQGHERLTKDCFVKDLVYDARMFRQRFRMSKHLFLRILESVQKYDSYFIHK